MLILHVHSAADSRFLFHLREFLDKPFILWRKRSQAARLLVRTLDADSPTKKWIHTISMARSSLTTLVSDLRLTLDLCLFFNEKSRIFE
jgi:hypothetical protein